MPRPCTCVECNVCGHGKCDCTCDNGPHLGSVDFYGLKQRIADMSPKQRKALRAELFATLQPDSEAK